MTNTLPAILRIKMVGSAVTFAISAVFRCLIAMLVISMVPMLAFSQRKHVLLSDGRALVTRIELSPGGTYTLPKNQRGVVWTALDPVALSINRDGTPKRKEIPAGEAEVVGSDEPQLQFKVGSERFARLIIVEPKTAHQDLTVSPFILSSSIEDASGRNDTLVVAISDSHFSDTRNLGDESEWIPSKPNIVLMKAGTVRWIRPGIHHFKNLGPTTAKLVSIEW